MRKSDMEQVIQLLKEEVDQLRIRNELLDKNNQNLEQLNLNKDTELQLMSKQYRTIVRRNKQLKDYLDQMNILLEAAQEILDNQKSVKLTVKNTEVNAHLALRYSSFTLKSLNSLQQSLISTDRLKTPFMGGDFEKLEATYQQATTDYERAWREYQDLKSQS